MRKSQANYFKNIIPTGLCTEFIYLETEGGKYYRWKNMRKGITKYHCNLPHYRFPPASTEPFDTQENSHIIKPTSQNKTLDLKFPTYPATLIQTFRSTCTDFSVEVSHMRKWALRGATIPGNSRHISLQRQQQRWPDQVLAERGSSWAASAGSSSAGSSSVGSSSAAGERLFPEAAEACYLET